MKAHSRQSHNRRQPKPRLRRSACALAIVSLITFTPAFAQPSLDAELRSALSSLPHPQTLAGACVIDLRTKQTVFDFHADRPLIPASTAKLFTITAGLSELGPDFAFETLFATDGKILYVIGDGDPGLGDERLARERDETVDTVLQQWADAALAHGLSALPGDLVIDDTIFDNQRIHPSWEPSDLGKWYAAPVDGLNFNDNCVDITVRPGPRPGEPVLVSVVPDAPIVEIINDCRTGDGTPLLHHPPLTTTYKITGRCNKTWPFGSVAFPDPGVLFADALRTVLARRGVALRGNIRRARVRRPDGKPPGGLTVLAKHRTPMADVLTRIGKNSQNLFAECLLKRAGYQWAKRHGHSDPEGSWTSGAAAVTEMLNRAGIAQAGLDVADGSGLSRDNTCTARQLVELLTWAQTQPWAPFVHDSLAEAGADGSLKKRLRDTPGRVFAKTGTMRGVRALAGYVDDDQIPRYAFAILFNNYPGPSTPYKRIQDRFCRTLIDRP